MSHDSARTTFSRRVRLARGVSPWLGPVVAATAVTSLLTRRDRRWAFAAAPLAAVTGGMLWFFRDPERVPGTARVLAPADGVVLSVDPQPDGRTRVAIFMSPLDVHVNRAPLAGTVTSVEHVSGGFLPAFNKDSEANERVVWHFDTALGDIELVQIAGAMARRVVPYLTPGAKVARGERIGLIRLGSRVDTYLPEGIIPAVTVGEKTIAGVTGLDHG
ncbi:phosphatidylserine decarboxylase family protein [Spongiactinospora gelatinilytica]|uniref:Phosphatidylserine decarboxylase family protein n=1 Tax=Spongiactinospora gelatinilytica TaxID=2666298 RepID=A0A2W2FBJ6_9ACTN|nr:phosphatidylserine decarboxylase [Spongiactinospora gelatinilytica]PZG33152.1 phosphatidylserine decarboxylase family protein [Spongiactinospora gelatinilytica]